MEEQYETGVWTNLKHGLQVGAGFFIGYFLMRFCTLAAMIVASLFIMMAVCVPQCEKWDRKVVAPVENKVFKSKIVNPEQVVWPKGCLVRHRPSRKAQVIGQTFPGRAYLVLKRRRGWIKIGGFAVKGWVGCRAYPMNKVIKHSSGKYVEI
jgi:hypothetical protein